MSKNAQAVLWAAVNAALVGLGQELAAGNVPVPTEWRFLVPVLVLVITALSPYVKRGSGKGTPRR